VDNARHPRISARAAQQPGELGRTETKCAEKAHHGRNGQNLIAGR
jgi:hypothetical protein